MTDPYIQINGTKIEVFDNDLSATRTIKQLSGGSKIITATRDLAAASGDVAYTGLDFTPTSIQCLAFVSGVFTGSIAFADSSKTSAGLFYAAAGIMWGVPSIAHAYISAGNDQDATVKTYDTGVGFTLTWIKTGSPTGTLNLKFLCFR